MSNKLVGACLDHAMPDLRTEKGDTVRDSTAKFVLLILCNSANDYGKGAYPGSRLIKAQTQFAIQTVTDALNALRTCEYIYLAGVSDMQTNDFTINLNKLGVLPSSTPRTTGWNGGVLPSRTNLLTTTTGIEIFGLYEKEIGVLTPLIADKLEDGCKVYSPDWVAAAVSEAASQNKRNWSYAEAILKRWKEQGYVGPAKGFGKTKYNRSGQPKPKDEPTPAPVPAWVQEMRQRAEATYNV